MIAGVKMNATPTESIKAPNPPRGIAISGLVFSALYISSLVALRRQSPLTPQRSATGSQTLTC